MTRPVNRPGEALGREFVEVRRPAPPDEPPGPAWTAISPRLDGMGDVYIERCDTAEIAWAY